MIFIGIKLFILIPLKIKSNNEYSKNFTISFFVMDFFRLIINISNINEFFYDKLKITFAKIFQHVILKISYFDVVRKNL